MPGDDWLGDGLGDDLGDGLNTPSGSFSAVTLVPPLQAILTGDGVYTCGDTDVSYQATLMDANGVAPIPAGATGYLHIAYANGSLAVTAPVNITGQTVTVAGVGGSVARASKCLHEVRMQFPDGGFATFVGVTPLIFRLPFAMP